jgi:hypothetical protein
MRKLNAAIEQKQANVLRLRAELAQEEADLKSMLRTRELVSDGNAPPTQPARMSIPDAIESVLRVTGECHVDDLLERLREMHIHTNKQSITSALTRYHNRQKRFRRVGKNRYALRIDGQTENVNEQEEE